MLGSFLPQSAICAALLLPPVFGATITTDTVFFGPIDASNTILSSESVPDANGAFFNFDVFGGLSKFDPAEGTLTAIRVTAQFDYSTNVLFESSIILNPGVSHTAGVAGLNHDLGIYLAKSSDPGSIYTVGGMDVSFPQSYGGVGNPGDGHAYSESFDQSDTVSNTVDIFDDVDLSDFVGVGQVTALQYGIFTPTEATFTLFNVQSATIDFYSMIESGSISIEYEFIPVPEASSAILVSLALGIAVSRRRRDA